MSESYTMGTRRGGMCAKITWRFRTCIYLNLTPMGKKPLGVHRCLTHFECASIFCSSRAKCLWLLQHVRISKMMPKLCQLCQALGILPTEWAEGIKLGFIHSCSVFMIFATYVIQLVFFLKSMNLFLVIYILFQKETLYHHVSGKPVSLVISEMQSKNKDSETTQRDQVLARYYCLLEAFRFWMYCPLFKKETVPQ